jgi:predicted lipid-binding transport protein (Tim44 family)
MNEMYGMLAVIAWFVSAVVGAIIGAEKGKTGKGALLGFLFGPFGWIMMMCDLSLAWVLSIVGIFAIAGFLIVSEIEKIDQARLAEEQAERARQAIAEQTLRAEQEAAANNPSQVSSPLPVATGMAAMYPAGVDTPEERREFLLMQIEAKKAGLAPAARTSNRARGY